MNKLKENDVAVIYARFSSHNQREESIEQQIAECQAYANSNKITVIDTYSDAAITGRSDRRPSFQRMQRDARKGKFGVIIAYKSSRIARNMMNALVFEAEMKKLGIRVLYAKEEFGDNAAGRFALRTMMSVNQFYSENLGEDIKRTQSDNAANCRANGPAPYGYRSAENGKFVIDSVQAPVVKEIFGRVARGDMFVDIANDFNKRQIKTRKGGEWGKSSFSTILHNERYLGIYIFDGLKIEGGMPQIIEKELFYQVQEKLSRKRNPQGRHRENGDYLLTGKLYCGECKSHMIGMSGTSKTGAPHHYYVCNNKRSGGSCGKQAIRREYIEREIALAIKKYILTDEMIIKIADAVVDYQKKQDINNEVVILENQLSETKKAIKGILNAIEQGIVTASTKDRLLELECEQSNICEQIKLTKSNFSPVDRDTIVAWLSSFQKGDVDDKGVQIELFNNFLLRAYVYDNGKVKVIFDLFGGESSEVDISINDSNEKSAGEFAEALLRVTIKDKSELLCK